VIEFAIKAYLYVRDLALFPYRFSLINEDWKASELIGRKRGHCIDKVVILLTLERPIFRQGWDWRK
jgi:hypothetical protein